MKFITNHHVHGLHGREYTPGTLIEDAHDNVKDLVACGALSPAEAQVKSAVEEVPLDKMNKGELVEYAKAKFNLETKGLNKDQILAAIAEAQVKSAVEEVPGV